MLELRPGRVLAVQEGPGYARRLAVQAEGEAGPRPAICYPGLTGPVAPGDRVWLNVAALDRGLGTGGHHFVAWGPRPPAGLPRGRGHIIKLNYTPWQLAVLAAEEADSPHHRALAGAAHLTGLPVVAAELHSQVGPVAAGIAAARPGVRVVFVQTDGAALPVGFSQTLPLLRAAGLLAGVITAGHSFGGDLEAVNLYSALLAARQALGARVAVVAQGPGAVGTATPFGFSGVEQGQVINAVHALGGRPVACLRLSWAEGRKRHRGVSHHTLTALGRVALAPALVALPRLEPVRAAAMRRQLEGAGVLRRHRLQEADGAPGLRLLQGLGLPCQTMGWDPSLVPEFFLAAAAAGAAAAALL